MSFHVLHFRAKWIFSLYSFQLGRSFLGSELYHQTSWFVGLVFAKVINTKRTVLYKLIFFIMMTVRAKLTYDENYYADMGLK